MTQGLNSLMGYELYDLVAVEQNVAGVVVMVGRTELRILDNHAALRTLKPEQLRGKLNRKSMTAVALDSNTNTITPGTVAERPPKYHSPNLKYHSTNTTSIRRIRLTHNSELQQRQGFL